MCLMNQIQFCSDCGGAIRSPIKMRKCFSCQSSTPKVAPKGPHEPRVLGEPLRKPGAGLGRLKKKRKPGTGPTRI